MVGEDGSVGVHKTTRPDVYIDSTCCRGDNRHLAGVIGAQNESSLFPSSLSDLVQQKLRLSNKILPQQSPSVIPQSDVLESFKPPKESEGQTINSLLPDEEELFSGIADEMGHMGHVNVGNDFEDFDLFIGSGGIELGDEQSSASQRNVGNHWGLQHNQRHSSHVIDHATPRLSNGSMFGNASPNDNYRYINGYSSSPVEVPSIRSEYDRLEARQAFPRVHLDSRSGSCFHPYSSQARLHNAVNVIPQSTLDGLSGVDDDIRAKLPEKVRVDMHHLGLNGHAMELNDGGFGYSSNGIHIPQSLASKFNSYQQHHLSSLLMTNSPSFMNANHAHHIGRLPGSPGTPHCTMNIGSPVHQLQVGSAPVIKAALWDRHQMYTVESRDPSAYQMGTIRSMGIPGFSPSHTRERSYGCYSHVSDVSKNGGLHSPRQMSHRMFHERNSMNSLPTSFGSPNERVRSRRNENSPSYSDRKHYELNVDRILRGDDTRTTLMIKNIPNKYTSKMLLATIDEYHRGKYDFVYLPIDFKNKCNMGYAFINMIDPVQIVGFHQTFEGRKWEKFNSEKVATLAYARIQGKSALIAHFQNSSLMNEDKRCRPILFHTDGQHAGDQEPFPMGTHYRPKSARQQVSGSEEDE